MKIVDFDRIAVTHCIVVADPGPDNLVLLDYTAGTKPGQRLAFTPPEAVALIHALASALASMNESRLTRDTTSVEHVAF
jgi:hypothetical protein